MGLHDVTTLLTLIVLELLLSADNAVVLALIARRLPESADQRRALSTGMAFSFALRAIALLLAKVLIQIWFLRALGGGYLIWICAVHFYQACRKSRRHDPEPPPASAVPSFVRVVTALALTDAVFALDTILVAVAVSNKLWLIYTGVVLGMIGLRLVSGTFLKVLERFPTLDDVAYVLVAWAGLRLFLDAFKSFGASVMSARWEVSLPEWVFWSGMGAIVVIGSICVWMRRSPIPPPSDT